MGGGTAQDRQTGIANESPAAHNTTIVTITTTTITTTHNHTHVRRALEACTPHHPNAPIIAVKSDVVRAPLLVLAPVAKYPPLTTRCWSLLSTSESVSPKYAPNAASNARAARHVFVTM